MSGGLLFTIVPVFIGLVFVLVIGSILYTIIRGLSEWSYNNAQPILDVNARVVAKRTTTEGGGGMHGDGMHNHSHRRIRTSHFSTFELDSGERLEFLLHGSNFGMLVEGDEGVLSYQGTRFNKFSRRL